MSNWLGDYPEDFTTVTCMFTTHAASGAPLAPSTAFEAADIIIYRDGSGTQKTTTNGVTMTSPFDSITGLHCVSIDTSDDTGDSGFWLPGHVYTLVLSPDETVDGLAVAKVVGQFGIELLGALRPTTTGRKLDVSAGGEAGIDWANIGSPTTAVNLSGTNIDVDQVVASVSGAVASVTGNVGGNVTGTIGGLTAAALKDFFDTDSTTTFASAVAGSVVKEIVDNAGGGSAPSAADIADAVWDEAIAGHAGAGSTGEALSAAGAAGDPWTTALPGAYGAGTAGKIIGDYVDAAISTRATQTSVNTIDDLLDTEVAAIKTVADAIQAKTDNLPSDPADASVIAGRFDTLDTSIADLPTNAELTTALGTADDAVLAQIALVKAQTDSLTFTVAGQVDANIQYVNDTLVTGTGASGDEWGP